MNIIYGKNIWDINKKITKKDLINVKYDCDIFIMISPGRVSTAGTNWEQGYMYGKGKRVLVFQFTEEPTSLMTFCGCSRFINTTRETIYDDILLALNSDDEQEDCKTTLT